MNQEKIMGSIVSNTFFIHLYVLSTLSWLLIHNETSFFSTVISTANMPMLNFLFITLPAFIISIIAAKAYLINHSIAILFIGNGFLFSSLCSLSAALIWLLTDSVNSLVTVHNLGVLCSSLCFASSSWLLSNNHLDKYRPRFLLFTYFATCCVIGTITTAVILHITPSFFIQGIGPSPIRQAVLAISIFLYFHSSLELIIKYYVTKKILFLWFFFSLFLTGLGLTLISVQTSVGGTFNLLGRFFQYGGHLYAFFVMLAVLHQAKKASLQPEDALADFFLEAKENYECLVETALNPIISTDRNNKILIFNSGAETLFHNNKSEVIGQDFDILTGLDTKAYRQNSSCAVPLTYKIMSGDIVNAQGNKIPVEICMSARKSYNGCIYTYIMKDLTEQRRYEAKMLRLSSLDLVGEMAAAIAHEVRNPLTVVRGYLQKFLHEDTSHQKQWNLLIDELDRANLIITEYLSLAKNKTPKKQVIFLSELVLKIKDLLDANALENGRTMIIKVQPSAPSLLDEKEIRQLILNLVQNAIEATPPNGVIQVEVYNESNNSILRIIDNGPGIAPELLSKLGSPFFTTKPGGTGLGLSVCYRIASRHNTSLAVQSNKQGTSFTISFPTVLTTTPM